ncbi:hypothetical protein SEA_PURGAMENSTRIS_29 [Mycobacterium phage Purgamenstris]|uniref:Uncharacterized protein n=1 Tax=Mycobacterium phage Purgamenstris TaxID=2530142 RepID=A0A481VZA9_9CAUD|nr:hypothetical protein SEA_PURGAMENSTRIS_29 [Mycobacterium phage Purgamenstris]
MLFDTTAPFQELVSPFKALHLVRHAHQLRFELFNAFSRIIRALLLLVAPGASAAGRHGER